MFECWKIAYERRWATLDQMKLAVAKKLISADEFKQITGKDYAASKQGGNT